MILSGRDLAYYVETKKLTIEPVTPEQFQQNGVDLILDSMKYISGRFYLGGTREKLTLPDNLMAFVSLRSTWAREGFIIPPTIVDAGFSGNLTIEILRTQNYGDPVGERFIHLIFALTSSPCTPYSGKYQNQKGITEAR